MNVLVISEKRVHTSMVVLLVYSCVDEKSAVQKLVYRLDKTLGATGFDGWICCGVVERITKRGLTFYTYQLNGCKIDVFVDRSNFDFEFIKDANLEKLALVYDEIKWPQLYNGNSKQIIS